jgi:Flp pilus assembly protein TadD
MRLNDVLNDALQAVCQFLYPRNHIRPFNNGFCYHILRLYSLGRLYFVSVVANASRFLRHMIIEHFLVSTRRRLLCTTMCCLLASTSNALAAFDPDAGADESAPISYSSSARKRTTPTPMIMVNRGVKPLYSAADRSLVPAVNEVSMPKPLYPSRAIDAASMMEPARANVPVANAAAPVDAVEAQTMSPLPEATMSQEMEVASNTIAPLPSVSAEVKEKAEALLKSESKESALSDASEEVQMAGYIAPPPALPDMVPMLAQPSAPASSEAVEKQASAEGAPVDIVEPNLGGNARSSTGASMNTLANIPPPPPVVGSTAPAPMGTIATSSLSTETKEILGHVTSRIGTAPAPVASRTTVSRVSPEVSDLIPNLQKEAEYEQVGLKISVSRESLDAPYELNRAYEALIAGDSAAAVDIYQNIIADQPQNQDALFGLAATYHRAGETAKARPLYGALLRMNPNHREALNNFLVLVSDEAPEEALFELQKLAERNPDFSPIRAQMGLVLEKLGQHDLAREEMVKAIRISPENLVYKYNLAVMMDRQGRHADASALYGLLVDAALRGEAIPAPLEDIQKRLNYINTASIDTRGS